MAVKMYLEINERIALAKLTATDKRDTHFY